MNLKKITLAAAAGIAVLGTAPAFADPGRHFSDRAPAHGWRGNYYVPRHHHRHVPPFVYYQPRQIYYPPPVFYRQIPARPGLRISFGFRPWQ